MPSINRNYNSTFLEKLLGKNYKWLYALCYYFKLRSAYRINNILFSIGQALLLLSTITVYYLSYKQNGALEKLPSILEYFIVGTILTNLVYVFPSFSVSQDIVKGKISAVLLKPQSYFKNYFFLSFGFASYQNMTVILILMLSSPLWISLVKFPQHAYTYLLLFLLLLSTLLILFLLEMLVGMSSFFFTENQGVLLNFSNLSNFLSGKLFPLIWLFPSFGANLINPFSYLFFWPMQIFQEKYSFLDSCLILLSSLMWCFVLYFLAKFVFKKGLKKNEAVGL